MGKGHDTIQVAHIYWATKTCVLTWQFGFIYKQNSSDSFCLFSFNIHGTHQMKQCQIVIVQFLDVTEIFYQSIFKLHK